MKKTGGTCRLRTRLRPFTTGCQAHHGIRHEGQYLRRHREGARSLLYTLMQYPQLTLFPLNSKATGSCGRPCERAGPKRPLGLPPVTELVKHFHHLLPVWRPDDVLTRKLAALCEGRRKAVNTRTGLGQQIKASSKLSSPSPWSCLRATARAS